MKLKFNISDSARQHLCIKAKIITKLFVALALLQLFLTFYFPLSAVANATEIYSKNLSSVIAFLALAVFLSEWAYVHNKSQHLPNTMKRFKLITILMEIVCICRIAVSVFYALKYLIHANLTGLYYVADVIAWAAVGLFVCQYLKNFNRTNGDEPDIINPKQPGQVKHSVSYKQGDKINIIS